MIVLSITAPQSSPKKKVEDKTERNLKLQIFTLLKLSSVDSYCGFLSLQEWET